MSDTELLTANQVAVRLGIKVRTVYAYVSRGVLKRHSRRTDGRSLFRSEDVYRLEDRHQRQPFDAWALPLVRTRISGVADGILYYRDLDATDLAAARSFESVCELLWLGSDTPGSRWPAVRPDHPQPPVEGDLLRHMQACLARVDRLDRPAGEATPEAVPGIGRDLIRQFTGARADEPVAGALWRCLSGRSPSPAALRALDAALILVAEHDLTAPTLVARVTAAARAQPHAAVAAALCVLQGDYQGAASEHVLRALRSMSATGGQIDVLTSAGQRVPGFGHRLHTSGDPRATTLLRILREQEPDHRAWQAIDRAVAHGRSNSWGEPNIDFALAAMGLLYDWPAASGRNVFAVGRSAGWLAHIREEYGEDPGRFRPRGRYLG